MGLSGGGDHRCETAQLLPSSHPSLVGDSQARAGTTGLYPRRCEGRTNRIVSLLSRKALDDLHLEVGSVAVAVVESTAVVVERAAPAGVPAR